MYLKDVNEILLCNEGEKDIMMEPKMANRHWLIAGARVPGRP
ncbi:MAG: DUF853 domain-containing protein [Phascolarctobacterium sp.]|nr:DUF853 domain-containing protein [Phascolarctobacterium sp.]